MSAALSARVQAALACLDQEGVLDIQTRTVETPAGKSIVIELEAGIWQVVDELASACGVSPQYVCHQALDQFPDIAPADAVCRLLDTVLRPGGNPCQALH